MDLTKARDRVVATSDDELELQAGRIIRFTEDIHDGSLHPSIKLNVLSQAGDILEMASVTGSVDPGALTRTPLAALGSGSPAPSPAPAPAPPTSNVSDATLAKLEAMGRIVSRNVDKVVDLLVTLIGPLDGLPDSQSHARATAMANIANGTTAVRDDGTLQVQVDLIEANRQVSDKDNELRTLRRQVDPLLGPLASLSDSDKRTRMKGMERIANGDTNLNPDGTPLLPTPDASVAALKAIVTDVKDHLRPSRVAGSSRVLDASALTDDTKAALGLTT